MAAGNVSADTSGAIGGEGTSGTASTETLGGFQPSFGADLDAGIGSGTIDSGLDAGVETGAMNLIRTQAKEEYSKKAGIPS